MIARRQRGGGPTSLFASRVIWYGQQRDAAAVCAAQFPKEEGAMNYISFAEREGIRAAVRIVLEIRFGKEGAALADVPSEQVETEWWHALVRVAATADSLAEVCQHLASAPASRMSRSAAGRPG
jgi:hypothetical protein